MPDSNERLLSDEELARRQEIQADIEALTRKIDERISSISDRRVENNVMRHEYKVLNDVEKQQMANVKDMGLKFWELVQSLGHHESASDGTTRYVGSREISLAQVKIEEAVFWAVKHLTK